jgi:hypothetical protein
LGRHTTPASASLCHVGEAQQWIEGCLEEELGFGVVEMEEGLRNGVVLAKLVRVFQGEKVVRKIYEVWQEIPLLLARILITIVNRRQSWTFDILITLTFSLTSSGRLAFPR